MIRIREISGPDDPTLKPAYALLKRTFHASERVTLREWQGSLRETASRVHTDVAWHLFVAERDGEVLGIVSGTYIGNINIGMIGYLAISEAARSLGLGTRLRNRLRMAFRKDAVHLSSRPLSGIMGEVSATNPWLRSLARKPNVLVLDFPYFQPSLGEGDDPSPFVLYFEQFEQVRTRLPVSELRRTLYAIWRRSYRIARPLDRPAFRKMLRAIDGRRTIGRHPVTKAARER